MKKIMFVFLLALICPAIYAQSERTTSGDTEIDAQERIQQLPPQETQTAVDRAARAADINTQNNQNVISAENRLQGEVERSTGKPDDNPARRNPKTVRPVRISDPTSNPSMK